MYLFPELRRDFSPEPAHPAARRNFFPRTPADDVADESIEAVLNNFRKDRPNYNPNTALLDEDRWGTTLWGIAAATHRARFEIMPPGYEGSIQPPLDALSIGLMRKCIDEAFGPGGGHFYRQDFEQGALLRKRKLVPIRFDQMVSSINYPEWGARPSKSRYTKEWSFFLAFGGKSPEKLTFTADLKTVSENPRVMGEIARISGVRLSGTKKEGPIGQGAHAIQQRFKEILRDQVRRDTLADRYGQTLETVALSASLQDRFAQILEMAEIPLPREALGALAFGRFPFDRMRYYGSALDLVFTRGCAHCRYPTKLSLEESAQKPNRAQRKAAAQIGNEILTPWHSELCGKTPEQLWRNQALKAASYAPRRIGSTFPELQSIRSTR